LRSLVHARRRVGHLDALRSVLELAYFGDDFVEHTVLALDRAVAQHGVAELLVQHVGVLGARGRLVLLQDALVVVALSLFRLLEERRWQMEGARRERLTE